MKKELLELLRCPEDRSRLEIADAGLTARLNAAITRGGLQNRAGKTLQEPLSGALLRLDRRLVYPIVDDIPRLLIDEAIELSQLGEV